MFLPYIDPESGIPDDMHLALCGLTIHAHVRELKVVDLEFVQEFLKYKGTVDPNLFKAEYLYPASPSKCQK